MFTYKLEKDDPNKPKILFYCANVLGVTSIKECESVVIKVLKKVYPILLIVLMISTYFYQLVASIKDWQTESAETLPEACASFILYCLNIYVTCKFHFGNGMKRYLELLGKTCRVEEIVSIYTTPNGIRMTKFTSNTILMFSLLIIGSIVDVIHTLRTLPESVKYTCMDNFYRLRLGICTLLICYTTKRIYLALRQIHAVLTILSSKAADVPLRKAVCMEFVPHVDLSLTLNHVSQMHVILTEAIAIFNQVHGFSIFLIDMYAITFFLVIFNIIRFQLGHGIFDFVSIIWTLLFVTITLVRFCLCMLICR